MQWRSSSALLAFVLEGGPTLSLKLAVAALAAGSGGKAGTSSKAAGGASTASKSSQKSASKKNVAAIHRAFSRVETRNSTSRAGNVVSMNASPAHSSEPDIHAPPRLSHSSPAAGQHRSDSVALESHGNAKSWQQESRSGNGLSSQSADILQSEDLASPSSSAASAAHHELEGLRMGVGSRLSSPCLQGSEEVLVSSCAH